MNVNIRFFIFMFIEKTFTLLTDIVSDEDIYPWYDAYRESKKPLYIKIVLQRSLHFRQQFLS